MLLLYHDHHKIGASGRTRTDEYEFTKLVLWLLRHRGKMASTAGLAPATSTFARWRSDLTELRGQNGIRDRTCTDLASQALRVSCPIKDVRFAKSSGPKGRLRELLAFTDYLRRANKWSPRLVSRQRLLVFTEALICLSYSGDGSPSRSSESEGWSSRQVSTFVRA